MNQEKPEGTAPEEDPLEEGAEKKTEGELRTPQEMRGELRAWIEMHEIPNRIKTSKRDQLSDMDGKAIPPGTTFLHDAFEGVRMRGETIYIRYGDEQGRGYYWIKLGDADYRASRIHGYTKARP